MASESPFVKEAKKVSEAILRDYPQFSVGHNKPLWYQIAIDNRLQPKVDVKKPPVKGKSAFQTDLCIFETFKADKDNEIEATIPRVVIEFKTGVTTHDIITYSAKAKKHKQVYPYLRYGLLAEEEATVPGRFFTHNESLDFCATIKGLNVTEQRTFLEKLLMAEIAASNRLEKIAFGKVQTRLYRNEASMSTDDEPDFYSPDADPENADWTKQSWDLPPYRSREFFAQMGETLDLAQFRTYPVYLNAVKNGWIVNDEWRGPPEGYASVVSR